LTNIKSWLHSNNQLTLWDISRWEENEAGNWKEWDLGNYPERLENEAKILLEKLQGKAPLKASAKDKRGWGTTTGNTLQPQATRLLQAIPHVPPDPTSWKTIWSHKSIPKIDMFTWTMAHKSILTSENLRRRGWQGPSRCPLCMTEEKPLTTCYSLAPMQKRSGRLL
jgi:hypothetical protein